MKTSPALEKFITKNRINTWEKLASAISLMSNEQRESPIIIELKYHNDALPGELHVCNKNHLLLENNQPVIFTKEPVKL